jgi:hypothetical protein
VNDRPVFHDEQAVARRQNRGEARSYVLEGRRRIDASSAGCTSKQESEWHPIASRTRLTDAHRTVRSDTYTYPLLQGRAPSGVRALHWSIHGTMAVPTEWAVPGST